MNYFSVSIDRSPPVGLLYGTHDMICKATDYRYRTVLVGYAYRTVRLNNPRTTDATTRQPKNQKERYVACLPTGTNYRTSTSREAHITVPGRLHAAGHVVARSQIAERGSPNASVQYGTVVLRSTYSTVPSDGSKLFSKMHGFLRERKKNQNSTPWKTQSRSFTVSSMDWNFDFFCFGGETHVDLFFFG